MCVCDCVCVHAGSSHSCPGRPVPFSCKTVNEQKGSETPRPTQCTVYPNPRPSAAHAHCTCALHMHMHTTSTRDSQMHDTCAYTMADCVILHAHSAHSMSAAAPAASDASPSCLPVQLIGHLLHPMRLHSPVWCVGVTVSVRDCAYVHVCMCLCMVACVCMACSPCCLTCIRIGTYPHVRTSNGGTTFTPHYIGHGDRQVLAPSPSLPLCSHTLLSVPLAAHVSSASLRTS